MQTELKEQLNKLKQIKPDESFLIRSRKQILSLEKKRGFVFRYPVFVEVVSFSFAAIFLVFLSFSLLYVFQPKDLPIASAETLKRELESMPVNIALQNIDYTTEITNTINKTIVAITNNKAVHMDKTVLEQEISKIEGATDFKNGEENINELLNKVLD